jgi:ketosteroid isomerase-like protein
MTDTTTDRLAVADVMIRYATSVDQRDLDTYATCFTDDVVVTGFMPEPLTPRGPYVSWVGEALSKYSQTHHLLGNQVVTVDGDTAHLRTYVTASHVLASDNDTMVILWGIYDDRLVRTAEGWKITHHHLERLINPRVVHAPER